LQVTDPDRRLNYYLGGAGNREKRLGNRGEDLRTLHHIDSVPDNSELPWHSAAYEYLGKQYQSQGRSDMEVEQYKAALASDSHNKFLHDTLKNCRTSRILFAGAGAFSFV
jgi:hypothetical protein